MKEPSIDFGTRPLKPPGRFLLIVGVILVAANLRAAITGLGPLVSAICSHTGLSNTLAGMLTTLPLLAFTLLSPVAPMIARRMGIEWTLFISLAVLAAGTLVRCAASEVGLFVGMFLAGSGIAMGNVLLPSLIKRDFPTQIGLMTGMYSVAMSVCSAIASGISVPISRIQALGWRGSLASWAILAVIGMVIWLPQLRTKHVPGSTGAVHLWKSGLAWQVTLFMGLQSFTFYVNVAWIPVLLHDRGMSATAAGWMLSLMQFVSLPASFIVPVVAGRQKSQRSLVVWIFALFLIGYAGLLRGTLPYTWLWIVFIGVAGGASISLALALFGLRSKTSAQAAELSGMAQSIGYLLAATGPIIIGFLHDATRGWTIPLLVIIVDVLFMLIFGLGAGRHAYVRTTSAVEAEHIGVGA